MDRSLAKRNPFTVYVLLVSLSEEVKHESILGWHMYCQSVCIIDVLSVYFNKELVLIVFEVLSELDWVSFECDNRCHVPALVQHIFCLI